MLLWKPSFLFRDQLEFFLKILLELMMWWKSFKRQVQSFLIPCAIEIYFSLTYCKDQATKSCFFHYRRMKLIMLKVYHKEVNTDIHVHFCKTHVVYPGICSHGPHNLTITSFVYLCFIMWLDLHIFFAILVLANQSLFKNTSSVSWWIMSLLWIKHFFIW